MVFLTRLPLQHKPITHLDHPPQLPVDHEAFTDLRPVLEAGERDRHTVEPDRGALRAGADGAGVEIGCYEGSAARGAHLTVEFLSTIFEEETTIGVIDG